MKSVRFIVAAVVAAGALTACAPSASQLQKVMEDNPDILFSVITKNPDKFLKVVNEAAQKARQSEEENYRKDEMTKREEEYKNPKQPVIDEKRAYEGKKGAPITVIEYSDFQCPFCKRGHVTMNALLKEYPDKVRVMFKDFPIERIHPFALKGSQYYEAIALQDVEKAIKFKDYVFTNQEEFTEKGEAFLKVAAAKVGANMAKVSKDVTGEEVKKRLDADRTEAEKFGFSGTPGYLINGVSLKGAYPLDDFKQIIERQLKK